MDQSSFETDRRKNCLLESAICDRLKTEPCWLGIDEAGRGPVLGPMVYGICFSPVSEKEAFTDLNFADSKTLTEEQRESIFMKMNESLELLGWMVEILSPTYISASMLKRDKYNLNALSHDCAIRLVQTALERGVNVTELYVDTVGDPAKYEAKLKEIFPSMDVTVAKKADSLYPIVSAASIAAKVARDQAVKNWQFIENINFGKESNEYGSGYPGDPKTKQFLVDSFDKVFGFTSFVRFSWSTAALYIEQNGVPLAWEDDEEETEKDTPVLSQFFKKKNEKPELKRHKFFTNRNLTHVTAL